MRGYQSLWCGLTVLVAAISVAPATRADDVPLPFRLVDQFNANFGLHPGYRANHARGAVFQGSFSPAPDARAFSTAAHLQDGPVPVTVRFSTGGGLPDAPDTHPSMRTRGMAIKFHLPGGAHYLSDDEAAKRPPNFLADDVRTRLKAGPVKFNLQVADPADKTDDATVVWPDARPTVVLGEIAITTADPDSLQAEKKLLFLPANVTPGIEPSADPLLSLRTAAYGVSLGRRSK